MSGYDTELVDILGLNGGVLGTISRAEAEARNHAMANVLVFVFTPDRRLWTQKRPEHKKNHPGKWEISACGIMQSGETALQAAKREQEEEMGFSSELQHVETFVNTFVDDTDGSTKTRLSHLFIGITEATPVLGKEEVDEFAAVPIEVLLQELKVNPTAYVPSFLAEFERALNAYRRIE